MSSHRDLVPPVEEKKVNKKKNRNTLKAKHKKEKRVGYLLVAPALILILAISIWPVIQSFYFSLFDLRLSNPTKSSIHYNYNLNLKEYLDSYPFLISGLDQAIQDNGDAKDELTQIKQQLNQLDQQIQKDPKAEKKYEKVNNLLNAYKPVNEDLALVSITGDTAEEYKKTISGLTDKLVQLNNKYKIENGDKIAGLAHGLEDAIIKPNFVGLSHYTHLLSESRTWAAIGRTVVFTVISVGAELLLGLGIALLINKAFFGRGLVRAAILIPWAVPTAVSALMWKFMYDGQNGIFAKIFETVGIIGSMSDLLSTSTGAMFSAIFADVWKTTPYMALLILAGLQTIPGSLYEAASIDGANKWKQFIKITLPLLKTSILVALLFRTLDAFRVFDLISVMTGGGPANSTEVISILAYNVLFKQTNFGAGSALSVIVFICVAIISAIYIKFLGRDLLGDGESR